MNILWLTLESILPANSGGRLGVYKRLEQIAKTDRVYLFYPYDEEDELKYVNYLHELCVEVHAYNRKENRKRALLKIYKYPFTVGSRCIPEMQKDIRKCIQNNKIDIINVDFPHMCSNLLGMETDIPIIMNEHNIEWKVYRTIAYSQKNVLKKFLYWMDSFRLKSYENAIIKKLNIHMITFVSENDMRYMIASGNVEDNKCVLIPVGADIKSIKTNKNKGHNIIFVGKMSYGPNVEAVTWFVNQIFPGILRRISDAKFYIVGKDPVNEVRKLASQNVIITGRVDSVDNYYDLADLVVLPLKNGGGVKVKLLEAISYRKPIVSSSVGVEGTIYADGKTVLVADSAEEFTEKCVNLLLSGECNVESAYRIFLDNYTWENIGKKYANVLRKELKKYEKNCIN